MIVPAMISYAEGPEEFGISSVYPLNKFEQRNEKMQEEDANALTVAELYLESYRWVSG